MSYWQGVINTTESCGFSFGSPVALWQNARLPIRLGAVSKEVMGSIFTFHILFFLSFFVCPFICCVRLLQKRNIFPTVSLVLVSLLWLLKDTLLFIYYLPASANNYQYTSNAPGAYLNVRVSKKKNYCVCVYRMPIMSMSSCEGVNNTTESCTFLLGISWLCGSVLASQQGQALCPRKLWVRSSLLPYYFFSHSCVYLSVVFVCSKRGIFFPP